MLKNNISLFLSSSPKVLGFWNVLFVVCLSSVSNNDGRSIRLDSMAANNVMETKIPNATVPPKSERAKIPNPKNRMIAL